MLIINIMGKKRTTIDVMNNSGIGEGAIAELKRQGISVTYNYSQKPSQEVYTKRRFLKVANSYDAFENLIIARRYIFKRYKVSLNLLEMLLYLYPRQYFTQADYKKMPKQYTYSRVRNIVATGYVKVVVKGEKSNEYNIYGLTSTGKSIVQSFYEILSGERKMSEFAASNPMKLAGASNYDKKAQELIEAVNRVEASISKKKMYE